MQAQEETALHPRHSLRARLIRLAVVCALPGILISLGLAISDYRAQQQRIHDTTLLLARQLAADLDRELAGIDSGLRVLATAAELQQGDLAGFHRRASAAVRTQIVYNYILIDRNGRQILNTLRPFGAPLPAQGNPAQLQTIFRDGARVITDLFTGPVVGRPVLAMGVPVYRGGEIIYSLNIGLDPARLEQMLVKTMLPPDWVVSVLDGQGTIIARTRDGPRYLGQPAVAAVRAAVQQQTEGSVQAVTKEGISAISSFTHSGLSGWAVAVGAPKASLHAELYRRIAWIAGAALLAFAVGIALALRTSGHILASIRGLNEAALALVQGQPVQLPRGQLREAAAVGAAIVQAAETLAQAQRRADHDVLTGLANRAPFEAMLHHQLELARRNTIPFSVLALDLDNFKEVNDQLGHPRGDSVLQEVARRIRETLRAADVAARIGGDEFFILLCEADRDRAETTAHRLLSALAQPYEGVAFALSASIGIAVYPQGGDSVQGLMEEADRLMYQAKKAGKNRLAG